MKYDHDNPFSAADIELSIDDVKDILGAGTSPAESSPTFAVDLEQNARNLSKPRRPAK